MALEFLVNPRSAPRARVRCRYTAVAGALTFQGQTEDIGPHGCQLVAPQGVPRGSAIRLELRAEQVPGSLHVVGSVAWVSPHEPIRLGVAFVESDRATATRYFDALVAAQPGLSGWRQVPDRISLDAMCWLAPPPRLVVDFTADEVAVLTAIGTGCTVYELKSRLRGRWAGGERAFFSLLAGRYVTLQRGGAVPFANWAELLRELQAELAAAALSEPGEPPATPPPLAAIRMEAPSAGPGGYALRGDGSDGMDLDLDTLELDVGAGAQPRTDRPREAEEAFQQALDELAAGRTISATALLRRALALAPGDPQIARKLGELAAGRR